MHPLLAGIPDGPAGLHAYFVHSYHLATESGDAGSDRRLRPDGHRHCRPRQHAGHAVSPGKEPDAGFGADRKFSEVEAVSLKPDLPLTLTLSPEGRGDAGGTAGQPIAPSPLGRGLGCEGLAEHTELSA